MLSRVFEGPIFHNGNIDPSGTYLSRVNLSTAEGVVVGTHPECWRCTAGVDGVKLIEVVVDLAKSPLQ